MKNFGNFFFEFPYNWKQGKLLGYSVGFYCYYLFNLPDLSEILLKLGTNFYLRQNENFGFLLN